MAQEFVVAFRDQGTGRDLKVDLNNGYVYGQDGSQVAKWDPKDSTTAEHEQQQLCAEWAQNEQLLCMRSAFAGKLTRDRVGHLMRSGVIGASAEEERTALMGLGVYDVHVPAAMPNFAGGYRQFAPLADIASPPLLAVKQSDKYFIFDKNDAFELGGPTVGANGAQPMEISPRLNTKQYSATEYALGAYIPVQLDAAADAPLRLRQAYLKRVLNALMMNRERRVAGLLNTAGNWNSSNVTTLGAGYQWDGGANSDPIKDIQTRVEQSLGNITAIIMAEPTWHAFQRNPNVQKYFQYKSGVSPLPSETNMSAILELPPIYVGRMKYLAPVGGALTWVWNTGVYFVRQPEQMPPTTQDDIATSYTFRWNASLAGVTDQIRQQAMGFGAAGGFVVREFFAQARGTMGGTQIVCAHWDHEVMTAGDQGGAILSAYQ